jgi:hypothetical protein
MSYTFAYLSLSALVLFPLPRNSQEETSRQSTALQLNPFSFTLTYIITKK